MARALGLDLGRRSGYAIAGPEYIRGWRPRTALEGPRESHQGLTYGEWRLGDDADHDGLFARLWLKLDALHEATPLTHVFYEASGGNFKSEDAVWIQIGLAAVVRCWARLERLQAERVNNSTVKSHGAQSGGASKADMIACATRLGWAPQSDHVADALFVLDAKLTEWLRRR